MSLPTINQLSENFRNNFRVEVANLEDAQSLRHKVYCEEMGFEPLRIDRRETDRYDAHSMHCMLSSADDSDPVGCIRLIMAHHDDENQPLPIERICATTFDRSVIDLNDLNRRRVAEVSRLAISSSYRSVMAGKSPCILLGLYLGALALAKVHELEYLLLLVEPKLARHLSTIGFRVSQIGGAVEHRGARIPLLLKVAPTIRSFRPILMPLWNMICAEIKSSYEAQEMERFSQTTSFFADNFSMGFAYSA